MEIEFAVCYDGKKEFKKTERVVVYSVQSLYRFVLPISNVVLFASMAEVETLACEVEILRIFKSKGTSKDARIV